jgi:hypothetical protein
MVLWPTAFGEHGCIGALPDSEHAPEAVAAAALLPQEHPDAPRATGLTTSAKNSTDITSRLIVTSTLPRVLD